jgi:protein tyrosine phosphatase
MTPILSSSNKKLKSYINYISILTDKDGHLIVNSNRKTGFLGFIIDLRNLLNLYTDLKSTYNFEYLLSFKLSQDHIETFFSAIRSRRGHNNNPSCQQFKASYKRLILKHEISG